MKPSAYGTWVTELRKAGYRFDLLFLWLPKVDLAVARVAGRVRLGGHDIPEGVVHRRYQNGLRNFFQIYLPLADAWSFYDNSKSAPRRPREEYPCIMKRQVLY